MTQFSQEEAPDDIPLVCGLIEGGARVLERWSCKAGRGRFAGVIMT